MPKAKHEPTTQKLIQRRIREIENEIIGLESKIVNKKDQLEKLRIAESSYGETVAAKSENMTYKQMAYLFIKKHGVATLTEIVDHFYPGPGKDRHQKVVNFTKGLNSLIETRSIKKIPAPKGKRGIKYEFIK